MMVVAASVASPWGPVHVAATAGGVVAVDLMTTREEFTDGLERRLGKPVDWVEPDMPAGAGPEGDAVRHLRVATTSIETAATGDIEAVHALRELPLDLDDRPAWDRAVLGAVRTIPRGEVRSYGEIARAIGRPGAARAVGGAVGRNPVGFLIPCHRVVAGDGTLGGYGGGWWGDHERLIDLKSELLAREGVSLPRSRSRGDRGR